MKVRAHFARLRPRLRAFDAPDGSSVLSLRWLGFGLDHIRSRGYRLTQWGRTGRLPLSFVCRCPGDNPTLPPFLYSASWQPLFSKRGLCIGRTNLPVDVGTFWRGVDARGNTVWLQTAARRG